MQIIRTQQTDGKKTTVYAPDAGLRTDLPLVLTFLPPEDSEPLAQMLAEDVVLLAVDEPDWEHAFTPWHAPAVFKKAADFGGGAVETLSWVTEKLLPETENGLGLNPAWRGIAGYSLAGLFAAWTAYQNPVFTRIACVSGSLWFDGWAEFVAANTLSSLLERAYFSLGDTEKNSKNPRMARVETDTEATVGNWRRQGVAAFYETNEGGHFHRVPERMAKAVRHLTAP